MRKQSVQFEKDKLLGVLSVLTFGLTAFFAVVGVDFLVPTIFVLGFFLVIPLIAILGDSLPMVRDGGDDDVSVESIQTEQSGDDPIDELRTRYARGELTDAEFERRLERLLETEDAEASRSKERVFDRE
ncbi:SHOCT domain-containing protein [Halorussus lipolyticus]|uniref:SHOCT domain-containing protein n=1 Tax=Halorussus lipolyticus TaxID=3034024 RepID=UPI0023E855AC|nr:SHOCT domain-containing protein [Halorussus sp. DT80]